MASVDSGINSYVVTLVNNWFGTHFIAASASVIFICTIELFCLAFFSCDLSVQAAGSRVLSSHARGCPLPASGALRSISRRMQTPVVAVLVANVLPALFALHARATPPKPVHLHFFTCPAKVNALFILVSFATSGIYLSFQMVLLGALIGRIRGWRPASFDLGRWAYPVYIVAMIYGVGLLVNIVLPGALTSAHAEVFNYGWMTLVVMFLILVIGAVVYLAHQPLTRHGEEAKEPVQSGSEVR